MRHIQTCTLAAGERPLTDVLGEPVLDSAPGVFRRGGVVAVTGIVEKRVLGVGFGDQFMHQPSPFERFPASLWAVRRKPAWAFVSPAAATERCFFT